MLNKDSMLPHIRQLILATALFSLAHGFYIFSGLFTSMPLLFNLNIFSDSNAQPDIPGNFAVIETTMAGVNFLLGVVGSMAILGDNRPKLTATRGWIIGVIYLILFIVQMILLGIRLDKTGTFYDWGWNDGTKTCRDTDFTGCPIARFLSTDGATIDSISDCKFNAFDVNNVNSGDGASQLVDWSNFMNYDSANAAVLATAAQSAGMDVDADALEPIHDCWYWGCHEICTDRYKLNGIWITYAVISVVVYALLSTLTFITASAVAREEELGDVKRSGESNSLEIPPDADGFSSSSELLSKDSSSSDKFLNLNLRI